MTEAIILAVIVLLAAGGAFFAGRKSGIAEQTSADAEKESRVADRVAKAEEAIADEIARPVTNDRTVDRLRDGSF